MMQFTKLDDNNWVANNTTKVTNILRMYGGEFMLYTPEGRKNDNFTSAGPFLTFEDAKRCAELNIEMTTPICNFF